MKKLCILVSVLMMICMLSTLSVSAAGDAITLAADKATVNVGEEVVITVGVNNEVPLFGTAKVVVEWAGDEFEFVSVEADSTTFALTNATTAASNYATTKYQVTFSQKVLNTEDRPTGENSFGTITLRALKATSASVIKLNSGTSVYVNAGTTTTGRVALGKDTTVAIAITEAGGSEEIFDVDVEAGYTKDAIAIFAKNVTDEAFAAGTYGVIFGGNKYAAGVNPDTACEAGKTFVVKFVGGAEKLASGAYKYQAYYNNGVDVTPEKVLNIQ